MTKRSQKFEYEIVIRVHHLEEPNPDMPTLNLGALAQHLCESWKNDHITLEPVAWWRTK